MKNDLNQCIETFIDSLLAVRIHFERTISASPSSGHGFDKHYIDFIRRFCKEEVSDIDEVIRGLRRGCIPYGTWGHYAPSPDSPFEDASKFGGWNNDFHQIAPRIMAAAEGLQTYIDDSRIYRIWIRSHYSLENIAIGLALNNIQCDAEDYWAWVIGERDGLRVDLTRTHTLPPDEQDTEIFLVHGLSFPPELKTLIVADLRQIVNGPIQCGRVIVEGNDGKRIVTETIL